jgi:hypothetical protein
MPHTAPDLRPPGDDAWLEGLLAADAAAARRDYIDDAGFTEGVMKALPAPAALPRWRKPAVALMWGAAGVAGAAALPGAVLDLTREAMRLVVTQPVSLSGMAGALVVLAVATWAGAALALQRD